ncbi:MAG: aminomethyl-transferring glycine dehydrogenase [Myxococcota bacterium]
MKAVLTQGDRFARRHIGPSDAQIQRMLQTLDLPSLQALTEATIPDGIRSGAPLELAGLPRGLSEQEALSTLREVAERNQVVKSLIGMGYYGTVTPPVIQRNILENPGWYTQYTPYQPEIAQGRLEALVNFQTMVSDLTGLPLANASLLDEATAAAEAMAMALAITRQKKNRFIVSPGCHPQTVAVLRTRAEPIGVDLVVEDPRTADLESAFAVLLQVPDTFGVAETQDDTIARARAADVVTIVASDLLALALMRSPGEMGADIAVGSAQRFGVPMGAGGPHAAFLATREEHKRFVPGRIIGVSRDAKGSPAYRLALQTREQHIRRDKATSNICTAQVLLAIMSGAYAVYHGPEGIRRIAERTRGMMQVFAAGLKALGFQVPPGERFDTLRFEVPSDATDDALKAALDAGYNLRRYPDGALGASVDETTTIQDVKAVLAALAKSVSRPAPAAEMLMEEVGKPLAAPLARTSAYLTHEVFNRFHSEHAMLRYLHSLQKKDLSLTTSMIPLGSCTMKLNATAEMVPVTWPEFANVHPFAPAGQQQGYAKLYEDLQAWLGEVTGFAAVSLQPNAGSQGEYTGLLVIRAHHRARGEGHRNVCLIPVSAHGTNPASAVMAGLEVVPVHCDDHGNIDIEDLEAKAQKHRASLAAMMITYPSTHGVFETEIRRLCEIVHENGGQVYLDGANLNAQVGLCRPGDYGADVCHLNLHKTFCIPHGGGGPGMGPIGVASHLAPFLPGHPQNPRTGPDAIGPVAAAPSGSPSILPISWMYMAMMGPEGLQKASQVAILNANYMAMRLRDHFPVLFTGLNGRVAHEFILDMRPFKKTAGVEVDDIAKRLMDYGFHAPTMSWPVAGTMMVEPTESEDQAELDRFCDALLSIREEIRKVEKGIWPKDNNPLKMAPHTQEAACATEWNHPYPREQAVFPKPWIRGNKFWPPVARVDNAYGDRHLMCTCPPMESFLED